MFGKRVPKSRRAPIIREYDRYLSPHFWRTSLMSKLGMINLHSLGGVLASVVLVLTGLFKVLEKS